MYIRNTIAIINLSIFSNKTLLSFSLFFFHLFLSRSRFRWPFKGYPPTHRRRPLLRLHQRQLHRCKWKRIECYYWLPTKPTKPHSLARMSGLYTFIASSSHPSCHRLCIQPLRTHLCNMQNTCLSLVSVPTVFLLFVSSYSFSLTASSCSHFRSHLCDCQ